MRRSGRRPRHGGRRRDGRTPPRGPRTGRSYSWRAWRDCRRGSDGGEADGPVRERRRRAAAPRASRASAARAVADGPPAPRSAFTLRRVTDGRAAPHPANDLNELTGEEWLYFTKSVLTTAYPRELGHARRKAHGANKPPRLMARLIEFFTTRGQLVLDPFAGVGGTLLGAAIARAPRRALGIELDRRWATIYEEVVRDALSERDGLGPELPDLGPSDPGGPRAFDPEGCELRVGDALRILPSLPSGSVDFVATDPPYNIQLPLTMAGGPLAVAHANRRTDYAMVSTDPADLANAATYADFLDSMERVLRELERVLRPGAYATLIVRDAYQDG